LLGNRVVTQVNEDTLDEHSQEEMFSMSLFLQQVT